jgi:1-acyl-sn-glycerol-3-phosphate acyltransferase
MGVEKVLRPYKEVNEYSFWEREKYYEQLYELCVSRKIRRSNKLSLKLVSEIVPMLRNFEIEIRGLENISTEDAALFVCNHSNSHDCFVVNEVFNKIKIPVSIFIAWDGLNVLSRTIFRMSDATFIKRNDSISKENGVLDLCSKIIDGRNGFIFGEATWNLHPFRTMQPVKAGSIEIALITKKKIIPTIFEYVEVPHKCKKERELYSKCIVVFGNQFQVDIKKDVFKQAQMLQHEMETMRLNIWKENGNERKSLEDIDKSVYLNHTYIKKFMALGFTYNSEYEFKFLLRDNSGTYENEFCLDETGQFVPGISQRSDWC